MTSSPSKKLTPAATIPNPHRYIQMMTNEYKEWVFDGDETKANGGNGAPKSSRSQNRPPLMSRSGLATGSSLRLTAWPTPSAEF